ncbi:ABC transporter ATP-binding protein [Lolliginicoccus suaedae]|uniref:ABC transporter ATP-binding protein n=1 Tax=Lolliginicoccus suaedae TaxID=2605429 RepID=UPI0011ED3C66|nr:ABC transporter ATP-binding protein [Lolliginicoccus suaedae]
MSNELVVEVDSLECRYGDFLAVRGVSFGAVRGECFALLGTNGAGKTTTLETVQGFRQRSGGSVRVFGRDPREQPDVVRRGTGVVLQQGGHFGEISVRETVNLHAGLSSRRDDAARVLERVDLAHKTSTAVQSLSGGERRRLDLALAMWGSPELIILDEPTTGLDPESRKRMWQVIGDLKAAGSTVLLTTHYLEEAEQLADRVGIVHEGVLAVEGTLEEVLASRPARVVAEVVSAPPGWWPRPPAGVSITVGDQRGKPTVVVEAADQQRSMLWLLQQADEAGVELGLIRANPASLDEVFHQIAGGQA